MRCDNVGKNKGPVFRPPEGGTTNGFEFPNTLSLFGRIAVDLLRRSIYVIATLLTAMPAAGGDVEVTETENQVLISTDHLEAVIRKKGYV